MADTYAGLTVRIGGDVTPLKKSLQSLNSSISTTQGKIRAMTQALKIDPKGADALDRQFKNLSNRAVELNLKLRDMNEATKNFLNQPGMRSLVEDTKNAALNAQLAKQKYNSLDDELARLYTRIQEVSGVDLRDSFKKSEEAGRKELQMLVDMGNVSQETADDLMELRLRWSEVRKELDTANKIAGFDKMRNDAVKVEAELKQVYKDLVQIQKVSSVGNSIGKLDDELTSAANASRVLSSRMQKVEETLKLDPSNVAATSMKMQLLAEETNVAVEKTKTLQSIIAKYEARGINKLANDLKDTALSAEQTKDKYREAAAEVSTIESRLTAAKRAQDNLSTKASTTSEDYKKAATQVAELEEKLRKAEVVANDLKTALDIQQQVEEYKDAKAELNRLEAQIKALKDQQEGFVQTTKITSHELRNMGLALTGTVTPAMITTGHKIVESSAEIDSAYRDMRKTVNGTEEQFVSLKDAAIDFSTTHFTSADQILSIEALGGQLGIAAEDLQTFSKTITNLDIATNVNAEEAAIQAGQLMNILNDLTDETMPKFGDALVRLGNNAPALESDILDITSRIGSMSSILGISTPDILAWSTAIAATGQGAEAAGTAISKTMSDIESAVGSGGESLQAFAEISGMTAEEFASKWESDPSSALKSFIEGLKQINDEGGSVDTTLEELGITSVRQKQALEGLTQTTDVLNDALLMSNDAWSGVSDRWGDAGDAAREAERKAEGFSGQMQILRNVVQAASAELGEGMVPILKSITSFAQGSYKAFSLLSPQAKTFVIVMGGLAALAGPITLFVGSSIDGFRKLSSAIGSMNATAGESVPGMLKLTGALKEASAMSIGAKVALGGLGAVLVAVALTGVAVFTKKLAENKAEQEFLNKVTNDTSKTLEMLNTEFEDAKNAASDFGEETVKSSSEIKESLDSLANSMQSTNASINDSAKAYQDQVITVGQCLDIFDRLRDSTKLTTTDQKLLKQAVDSYNSVTGDTLEILDNETGALSKSSEELRKNSEEWKKNAREKALVEAYTSAGADKLKAELQLNDALRSQADIYGELSSISGAVISGDAEAIERQRELTVELEATNDSILQLSEAYNEASEAEALYGIEAAKASELMNQTLLASIEELPAHMQSAGLDAAYALSQGISEGSISVEDASAFLNDSANLVLSNLPPELQGIGYAAVSGLSSAIASGQVSVANAMNILQTGFSIISTLPENMKGVGTQAVQWLVSEVQAGTITGEDAIAMLNNAMEGKADELPDKLKVLGEASGSDYASGVSSKTKDAKTAGSGLGQAAIDGANGKDYKSSGSSAASSWIAGFNSTYSNWSPAPKTVTVTQSSSFKPPSTGGGDRSLDRSLLSANLLADFDEYPIDFFANEASSYAVETTRANYSVPSVTVDTDNTANAVYQAAELILNELPYIIADYTPTMSSRDFSRAVKKYG